MVELTQADYAAADSVGTLTEQRRFTVAKTFARHRATAFAAKEAELAAERAKVEKLREALEIISDGMEFPNQLESGFVHGKPTFTDMAMRVDLAQVTARAALAETQP